MGSSFISFLASCNMAAGLPQMTPPSWFCAQLCSPGIPWGLRPAVGTGWGGGGDGLLPHVTPQSAKGKKRAPGAGLGGCGPSKNWNFLCICCEGEGSSSGAQYSWEMGAHEAVRASSRSER